MNYLKKYNTFEEYNTDKNNLPSPSIAYVLSTNTIYYNGDGYNNLNVITDGDTIIYNTDLIYLKKDGNIYPISHPDLSTQPSILPQRYGNLDIKEVLIANGRENEIPKNAIVIEAFSFDKNSCVPAIVTKTLVNTRVPICINDNNDMFIYAKESDFDKLEFRSDYYTDHLSKIDGSYYLGYKSSSLYEYIISYDNHSQAFIVHNYTTKGNGGHATTYTDVIIPNGLEWRIFNNYNMIPDFTLIKYVGDDLGYYYEHNYSQDYLTFVALQDGTFQFSNSINYSIDNGATWTQLAANTATPTITSGNKIIWKATLISSSKNGIGTFSSTGDFDVEGNVMSLLYGDNFIGQTDLTSKDYTFFVLFNDCRVINAEHLSLPATTLARSCYGNMFYRCSSLTTAPELPATTLTEYCYAGMFEGCISLTTAPELHATILANYCYDSMFRNCSNLTTAPTLSATTLANYCYIYMFYGCTSLNYIKAMFTTTPGSSYTSSWVEGVAASGTFVKNSAAEWDVTGVNGVPKGWTVQTASS